ncbi:MAG: hypothetical protein E7645_04865 [Ruminococcaceae bacterium]|nr:hypothetical protein [Oscillospiraceae bacterium]
MKKILVLASILLVLTLAFVACTEEKPPVETPGETVAATDPVTDAPVAPTEEPTAAPVEPTDAPTDAPVEPTDEPVAPTEEPAAPTDEPEVPTEEPETLPYVEPSAAGANGPGPCVDALGVNNTPVDKSAESLTIKTGETFTSVDLHGWVGFAQNIKAFGYFVNDGEFVYDEAFATILPEGDPVLDPANGGANAQRFNIYVPASALSVGENKVGFVVQLADDTVVILRSVLTVNYEKTNWNGSGIITHQSFDQLYFGTGDAVNGPENIFTPGASAQWDGIVNCDFSVDTLTYWGWIGYMGELGQFGYQVNGGEAIYNADWAFVGGDHEIIIGAAQGGGAESGNRMKIAISLAGIGGEGNVITVLYKNAEGVAVVLGEFVVNRKNADLNVPQDQWVISGHMPQLVAPDHASHGAMVAAGGVESAALLHQGSIYLGNLDLSKYSKIVIMWGSDASQVTIDAYNANANNRFALVSADKNMVMSPDEATIIAAATYELHGWAVAAFEIDLTNVDYSGDVYLTHDSLPGGFALVSEITFIGSDVDPNYEPESENWVVDLSTIEGNSKFPEAGYGDASILKVGYNNIFSFGEVNLGQYSKIIIEYSYDGDNTRGDGRTPEQCFTDAAVTPIIGFTALDKCFGYADQVNQDAIDNGVKAEMVYTPGSWAGATRTAEIDTVMYSGVVYLTVFNPWGTEVVVSSVTFVK